MNSCSLCGIVSTKSNPVAAWKYLDYPTRDVCMDCGRSDRLVTLIRAMRSKPELYKDGK